MYAVWSSQPPVPYQQEELNGIDGITNFYEHNNFSYSNLEIEHLTIDI